MTKPIFILGLPNNVPTEILETVHDNLIKKLDDYHVLVLRNVDDKYSAKLFAVEGVVETDLAGVEKYIKSKL